jgi:hypothetical protein
MYLAPVAFSSVIIAITWPTLVLFLVLMGIEKAGYFYSEK